MPAGSRLSPLLALLLVLLPATAAAEQALRVEIGNRGPEALRCQWQLAHWMTAAAARLEAGQSASLEVWREEDGALFLRRQGEARPFHIEALTCGPDADFGRQGRSVALSILRRGESEALAVTCSTAAAAGCLAEAAP